MKDLFLSLQLLNELYMIVSAGSHQQGRKHPPSLCCTALSSWEDPDDSETLTGKY